MSEKTILLLILINVCMISCGGIAKAIKSFDDSPLPKNTFKIVFLLGQYTLTIFVIIAALIQLFFI